MQPSKSAPSNGLLSTPSNKLPCAGLSLESNKPRGSWYGLTEVDQNEIYFPTLQISGAKTIQRTRKYGPKDFSTNLI